MQHIGVVPTSVGVFWLLENLENLKGTWITSEELGVHLGYSEPRKAILKLLERQRETFILGEHYAVVTLTTPSGTQKTTIFNERGALKLMRYSQQPVADAIMDEVFDVYMLYRKVLTNKKFAICLRE